MEVNLRNMGTANRNRVTLRHHGREVKCFIVNSKDLFDKCKNPELSLSVKDILANKKIKKKVIVSP